MTTPETTQAQLVRAMVKAINARDLHALDEIISENVVRHCAATPDTEVRCLADFKDFLRRDFESIPDSVVTVDFAIGCGDYVAMRSWYEGTQQGPFGPFPPSGKRMRIPFVGILLIENGKISEMWVEWDNLNALMQLGHLP